MDFFQGWRFEFSSKEIGPYLNKKVRSRENDLRTPEERAQKENGGYLGLGMLPRFHLLARTASFGRSRLGQRCEMHW
jgi:hypothetical protein